MSNSTRASKNTKVTQPVRARKVRKTLGIADTTWTAIGRFLTSRSSDLALMAIVIGAFVAIFEGSLYSAKAFAFSGASAVAFAIMPDALMVLSAAKGRKIGISDAQWRAARTSMRFGLAFSLLTNMIAAFIKYAPAAWITPTFLLVGAIAYHGVVVMFLWRAVETLTKVRADRKGRKASNAPASVAAPVIPVHTGIVSWTDTVLGMLNGTRTAKA